MTRKADDLSRRAAAVARRDVDEDGGPPAPRRRGATRPPRVDPVRITADLAPVLYRRLTSFAANAAADLGVARVSNVDVVRALVELLDDKRVAEAVRERLSN